MDFSISNILNYNFVNNLETACRAGKEILFDKLLVNYVRDDVKLFTSGELSVSEIYYNFFKDLKELESETDFTFSLSSFIQQRGNLFDSIIDKYDDIYNRLRGITNETSINTNILNYLQSKGISMDNLPSTINNNLNETYQRLVTSQRMVM